MNRLTPRPKWFEEWFPVWDPDYMIRPLHGDPMPSQIRIDVSETDEAYEVKAELPGVNKDDIDVQIRGSLIMISAQMKQEDRSAKEDRILRSERYTGRISRSFELPGTVDVDRCEARYVDGILSLMIPKTEPETEHQKIEIR